MDGGRTKHWQRTYGRFHCKDCKVSWESAYTWNIKGTSTVVFRQKCRKCGEGVFPWRTDPLRCPMCYSRPCMCPKGSQNGRHVDPKKSHRSDLCEKCLNGFPCYPEDDNDSYEDEDEEDDEEDNSYEEEEQDEDDEGWDEDTDVIEAEEQDGTEEGEDDYEEEEDNEEEEEEDCAEEDEDDYEEDEENDEEQDDAEEHRDDNEDEEDENKEDGKEDDEEDDDNVYIIVDEFGIPLVNSNSDDSD